MLKKSFLFENLLLFLTFFIILNYQNTITLIPVHELKFLKILKNSIYLMKYISFYKK